MSQEIKLGEKEKEVLNFLKEKGGAVWKEDVINQFSYAKKYQGVINKRLIKLQQKGFIEIKVERNPDTGKQKQKVYLKQ
jgi:uncharacterized membrane protein